jgi:anti-anti-sigma factor
MNITESVENGVSRIFLAGRFDANTCEAVERYIRERIDEGVDHMVIDMSQVSFIASAGLRVVLVTARELRRMENGDLRISGLQPAANRVFEISGLNNVIQIFSDFQTATESFSDAS